MSYIEDIAALEALYDGPVSPRALSKVQTELTPQYRRWIAASRFCVLTTVGAEGTDGSPRGDDGPVALPVSPKHLAMPDWRGNNRLDSLRNIVTDGRVSLMFMVAGSETVVRVNGTAKLSTEPELCARFSRDGALPRSVIVTQISEIYFQCAKAIMRAKLWSGEAAPEALPTAGAFLKEAEHGFDAEAYDAGYAEYAATRMW